MLRTCESKLLNLRIDTGRNNIIIVLARPSILHDWLCNIVVPHVRKKGQRLVITCFTRSHCDEVYSKLRSKYRIDDVGLVHGLIDPEVKTIERKKPIIVTTYHALLTLTRYLPDNVHVVLLDVEHMFMNVKTRILLWSILTRLSLRQATTTLVSAYFVDVDIFRKLLSYAKIELYNLGDISTIGEITLVKAEYYTESLSDRIVEIASHHVSDTILIVCDSVNMLQHFAQELQRLGQPTYVVYRSSDVAKVINRHEAVTILSTSGILKHRFPIDVAVIVIHSDRTWTEHKLLSAIKDVWATSRKIYIVYNNRDDACRRLVEKVINLDISDIYFPKKYLDTYILYVTYPEMKLEQVVKHVLALPFLEAEPRDVHRVISEVLCRAKLVELTDSDTIRHTKLGQVLVEQCFTVDEFLSIFNTFISTRRTDSGVPDPEKTFILHIEPTLTKYVDENEVKKLISTLRERGLEPQVDPRLLTGLVHMIPEVVLEAYRIAKLLYILMLQLKFPKRRKYAEVFHDFENRIYKVLNMLRNHVGKEVDRDLLSSIISSMLKVVT